MPGASDVTVGGSSAGDGLVARPAPLPEPPFELSFTDLEGFLGFLRARPRSFDPAHIEMLADAVRRRGCIETRRYGPQPVRFHGANYREDIRVFGMPGRCFALLDVLDAHTGGDRTARVLCLEGLTAMAQRVRETYVGAICSEYAPTPEEQRRIAPVPHIDVQAIALPEASLDAVVSGDVFEHVPRLDLAIAESRRVLRPGGAMIATFPFACGSHDTIQRAVLENGRIRHLIEPPEYHGDPVRPDKGVLVFQVPGWDIIQACAAAGFSKAEMLYISDVDRGLFAADFDGLFVLKAIA